MVFNSPPRAEIALLPPGAVPLPGRIEMPGARVDPIPLAPPEPAAMPAIVRPGARTGGFAAAISLPPKLPARAAPPKIGTFEVAGAGEYDDRGLIKDRVVRVGNPHLGQTSGFGDASVAGDSDHPARATQGNPLGPAGFPEVAGTPGHRGNGTPGKGPVLIGGSGFGNGLAQYPGHPALVSQQDTGGVRTGGFKDVIAQAVKGDRREPRNLEKSFSEVDILYKPRPAYTDEARNLQIEGEVVLKALFTASGVIQVLGVLKGLGHGLDEGAIQAAQKIRFKPARRNGQPIDSTAVVHIIFQLAY